MDKFKIITKNKLNELPKTIGVYCFYERNKIIYIGKAINIKDRVKNHFSQPSYRDNLFVNKVEKIGYFETGSEIEALILEANLIKKYQPKYNVMWRDDKNYFYVAITENKDKIPYVFITHQPNSSSLRGGRHSGRRSNLKTKKIASPLPLASLGVGARNDKIEYMGPFTEGAALKKTLKFLRRAFPYYTAKSHPKNNCTYCHLGLCPGPSPDAGGYKKNIKKLIFILKGKKGRVLSGLKKEMKTASMQQDYEKAGKTRDKIYALRQVMAHTKVIANSGQKIDDRQFFDRYRETEKILQKITDANRKISRIECYDISNIQGKQATGSMVVFANGRPDKNSYRKFRIKIDEKPNDVAMIKEVLQRRLKHLEWEYPDLILIDGGKPQLNAAISIFKIQDTKFKIPILAIAKRNNELFIEGRDKPVLLKTLPREIFNLILQLRDEAHRFAITYHKKLRKKQLLK